MTTFIIVAWLVSGLIPAIWMLRISWKERGEIVLGEIPAVIVFMLLGPILWIMAIKEAMRDCSDMPIIKKKKP